MANIHSQKKRILRSERERLENRQYTSAIKTYFRRLEVAVAEGGVLLRGDGLEDRYRREPVAEDDGAGEVLVAVGGHHRREARLVEKGEDPVLGPLPGRCLACAHGATLST